MTVLIPSPLLSYTQKPRGEAAGATIADLLADLDRQYPGLRFRVIDEQNRMRPHVRFFVNGEQVFDLTHAPAPDRRGADRASVERRVRATMIAFTSRLNPCYTATHHLG